MADESNPTSQSPNVLGPLSSMANAEASAAIVAEELAEGLQQQPANTDQPAADAAASAGVTRGHASSTVARGLRFDI